MQFGPSRRRYCRPLLASSISAPWLPDLFLFRARKMKAHARPEPQPRRLFKFNHIRLTAPHYPSSCLLHCSLPFLLRTRKPLRVYLNMGIFTTDRNTQRCYTWIYFFRITGILLSIAALGSSASLLSAMKDIECNAPPRMAYNIAAVRVYHFPPSPFGSARTLYLKLSAD